MRQVYAAAAALLLLACAATALHLETVFTVAMPYSQAHYPQSAVLLGDGLYVITDPTLGVVEAVNLTTRTNMWVSANLSTYGEIETITATPPALLLQAGNTLVALSTHTGHLLWAQAAYVLQFPPAAYVYGNTIYAAVLLPSELYALQAFDLATGTPGFFHYSNALQIDGNTAFIAEYGLSPKRVLLNPQLRAVDIPTNTTLWTIPAPDNGPIQVMNSEYLVLNNYSASGDEIAVVLHRKNGSLAQAIPGFNGFAAHGVAALRGHMLLALIGWRYPRYVLVDLITANITWTRSAAEFYGAVIAGDALVSVASNLVLSITPIGGGGPSLSVPHVPSLPGPSILDVGNGLVQVGNLQGYTWWDTTTGTFVGSNEQMPNNAEAVRSAPLKWNGLRIVVFGNVVTATKVAK